MFDDWDLRSLFEYNPGDFDFALDDIDAVLAVIEGERDEGSWQWVVQLKNGRFAAVEGWCCYTGWDCQAGGESLLGATLEEVITYFDEDSQTELLRQVREGREKTRRQEVGEALGLL